MQISVSNNISEFKPADALSMAHLAKLVTNGQKWSSGIFKDGKRLNENFELAETIALDFDDGLSLSEAVELFSGYKHVIYTTRSHGIKKNNVVADRFRVILRLTEPITDVATYRATWYKLAEKFPDADPACKDPARYWEPGQLVTSSDSGELVPIERPKPKESQDLDIQSDLLGMVSRRTLLFCINGAPDGHWNHELTRATIDLSEQGYSLDHSKQLLSKATGYLDQKDINTIECIFSGERQYMKRGIRGGLNFKKIGDLGKGSEVLEWLVRGLLTRGGMSIISGQPKSGKSSLARQMALAVSRGEQFLDRETKAGQVLYIALEEQESLLAEQFDALGRKPEDNLLVHVGRLLRPKEDFTQLRNTVMENKPALLIVDTLALMANFENQNNYNEVNDILFNFQTLARESNTHIHFIHHSNKTGGSGVHSISGSAAISGAMDTNIILEKRGSTRVIHSHQRGGIPYDGIELIFDPETGAYELGEKYDDF